MEADAEDGQKDIEEGSHSNAVGASKKNKDQKTPKVFQRALLQELH